MFSENSFRTFQHQVYLSHTSGRVCVAIPLSQKPRFNIDAALEMWKPAEGRMFFSTSSHHCFEPLRRWVSSAFQIPGTFPQKGWPWKKNRPPSRPLLSLNTKTRWKQRKLNKAIWEFFYFQTHTTVEPQLKGDLHQQVERPTGHRSKNLILKCICDVSLQAHPSP